MTFSLRRLATAVSIAASSAFLFRVVFFDANGRWRQGDHFDAPLWAIELGILVASAFAGAAIGVLFTKEAWKGGAIGAVGGAFVLLLYGVIFIKF